jgi:hypothetical protein
LHFAPSHLEINPYMTLFENLNQCARLASKHSYDILGARMLWKPKEARTLKNFIEF